MKQQREFFVEQVGAVPPVGVHPMHAAHRAVVGERDHDTVPVGKIEEFLVEQEAVGGHVVAEGHGGEALGVFDAVPYEFLLQQGKKEKK